jgi:hypothetical protein
MDIKYDLFKIIIMHTKKFILALAALVIISFSPGITTVLGSEPVSPEMQKPKPPPKPKAPKKVAKPKAPKKPTQPKKPKPAKKPKAPPKPPWVK